MTKYEELKRVFESAANDEDAFFMAKYMRDQFAFYGIPTPKRRKLVKPFIKRDKARKVIDWQFLDACYQDEHREFQYFVNDYLAAMGAFLTYDDIPKIFKYVKARQWWDTIDFLDKIIGDIGLKDKRVDELMLKWSVDEDFWVRRVAIDHQLGRKEKTNTDLLEKILTNNFGSKEFFINKAIGWALRDYSKTNPDWVRYFIGKYKNKMDKLNIREGSKYI
jgi:3-methyladenine DNA glycosylase AlkD